MTPYKGFAGCYDLLMGDVDYDGWVDYLEEIYKRAAGGLYRRFEESHR